MNKMQSRIDKLERTNGANGPEIPDYIWLIGVRCAGDEPVDGDPVNGHRMPIGAAAKGLPLDDGQGAIWKRDPLDGELHPHVGTDNHE